ncbi:MAG: glycosyltransferase [Planctomycetaceae bacterium]
MSVIIPVGPGETCWRRLVAQIGCWSFAPEVILVDTEDAVEHADDFHDAPFRRIVSAAGRAVQMNAGAREATQPVLWFLHADSQVDDRAAHAMRAAAERQPAAIHFLKLAFDDDGPWGVTLNGWGVWFRSRILGLPFGDQGFCLSKRLFLQLGEFDTAARFGEDHLLIWRAHRHKVAVRQVAGTIVTSARKYADRGWWETTRQHLIGTVLQAFPEWMKLWRGRFTFQSTTFKCDADQP